MPVISIHRILGDKVIVIIMIIYTNGAPVTCMRTGSEWRWTCSSSFMVATVMDRLTDKTRQEFPRIVMFINDM